MPQKISLCPHCYCMTKTIKGKCGKCKGNKMELDKCKCGGIAELVFVEGQGGHNSFPPSYYVFCKECGLRTPNCDHYITRYLDGIEKLTDGKAKAISIWRGGKDK